MRTECTHLVGDSDPKGRTSLENRMCMAAASRPVVRLAATGPAKSEQQLVTKRQWSKQQWGNNEAAFNETAPIKQRQSESDIEQMNRL